MHSANWLPLRRTCCQRLLFLAHAQLFLWCHTHHLHDVFVKRETSYILSQKLCFNIPCPRPVEMSIVYVGAKRYSKLDNEVRNIDSMDAFKRTVRKIPREFYSFKYMDLAFISCYFYSSIVLFFLNTF